MRDNWITKTFDQLGDILIGGTPARNNALFWSEENTGNAWVSIADLSKAGKKITNTKESITDLGVRASNVKKIPVFCLLSAAVRMHIHSHARRKMQDT